VQDLCRPVGRKTRRAERGRNRFQFHRAGFEPRAINGNDGD